MKKTILTLLVSACCALVAQQAFAVNGTVTFTGAFSTDNNSDFTKATKFTSFSTVAVSGGVNSPTGDYAGSAGSAVTMIPYTFRPSLPAPITDQWSFSFGGNTFTFDLNALTLVSNASKTSLHIEGSGTMEENGGNDTFGVFIFDGNALRGTLSFTQTNATVPDGGSAVALLGIALAGIEAGRRLIRARKA